jgi:hypothetical protein
MLKKYFIQFVDCHEGNINKVLHVIGLSLVGIGIYYKSLAFVLVGSVVQELGHTYQYLKTRDPKASPWHCLKPQSIFAYPILILIIIYVVWG